MPRWSPARSWACWLVGDRGPGCVPRVKTAARIPREPGQQQHGGDDDEDPPEHHDETERDQQH